VTGVGAGLDARERSALRPADPCAMVLFGATGDLAHRLVIPALYNLACSGMLPTDFALIGVARHGRSVDAWRKALQDGLEAMIRGGADAFTADHLDEAAWKTLSDRMAFVAGDLADPALYVALKAALGVAEASHRTAGNALFYLAVEDRLFATVVDRLAEAKLTTQRPGGSGWRRVVIEKPFGHSLTSARTLNADLARHLGEDQIFRIDHFLGKDAVQNIMAFRFANGLFESIWNRDRIDHVQITAAETLGVEARGDFYERTGALRDMVPNHLLSLMSLVAMEPPIAFDSESLRGRRADVLAATVAADPARAERGQYGAGRVGAETVPAYRDEPHVAAGSTVETYAALELRIDNWRWAGTPFFVRTGKRLAARMTEIAIRFKPAPAMVFQHTPPHAPQPGWLILRIAPDESITLQFELKRRGPAMDFTSAAMAFNYDDWIPKQANVGYETLLYDVMVGDQILFMRADMVEQGWRIVQPVLDAWSAETPDFPNYASGGDGPRAAGRLIAREDGQPWRPIQAAVAPET
jgi:glucose-6-phosphate 1-dehydrogenase